MDRAKVMGRSLVLKRSRNRSHSINGDERCHLADLQLAISESGNQSINCYEGCLLLGLQLAYTRYTRNTLHDIFDRCVGIAKEGWPVPPMF